MFLNFKKHCDRFLFVGFVSSRAVHHEAKYTNKNGVLSIKHQRPRSLCSSASSSSACMSGATRQAKRQSDSWEQETCRRREAGTGTFLNRISNHVMIWVKSLSQCHYITVSLRHSVITSQCRFISQHNADCI